MPTFLVIDQTAESASQAASPVETEGVRLETLGQLALAGSRAGATSETVSAREFDDKTLVEITYEDGVVEWMRSDALQRRLEESGQSRSADGATLMPARMPIPGSESRGTADIAIAGVKMLSLTLLGKKEDAVDEFVALFEEREGQRYGLHRVGADGRLGEPIDEMLAPSPEPTLILLHGTFSSIEGTFRALFDAPEWPKLYERYSGRVYGFDHRTLSQSPLENALELIPLLADNARIHLLSHSRGGLIGELLCLDAITDYQLHPYRAAGEKRQAEIEKLQSLSALVQKKKLLVDRFVRVACPAAGTLIVSERLDRYLSILFYVITRAFDLTNPFVGALKTLILGLIKERANPEALPGLEAMISDSPFIGLLNRWGMQCNADLAVIAGDARAGGSVSHTLTVLATDAFFLEDHDFVVNTAAMSAGVPRRHKAYRWFERSAQVSHFRYFANPESRRQIVAWLVAPPRKDEALAGFDEISFRSTVGLELRSRGGTRSAAATVILIPDVLASHLRDKSGPIWLEPRRLAAGLFAQLDLRGEEAVTVGEIVADNYAALYEHLAQRFDVLPFAYDWRRSLNEPVQRLADIVAERVVEQSQPLYLLGHGAGGLVARLMIAQKPELWAALKSRGGRLLMAGTPQRGSYAALELVSGQARWQKLLAMVDPATSTEAVARLLWSFPGVVELLPHDLSAWERLWSESKSGELIDEASRKQAVKAAQQTWREWQPVIDPQGMRILAGADPWTPTAVAEGTDKALQFSGDGPGDGVVSHESSHLPGVPVYYLPAAHGDLLNYPPAFPAIADLLAHGEAPSLVRQPIVYSGRNVRPVSAQRTKFFFPSEDELVQAVLGGSGLPTDQAISGPALTLKLSVKHSRMEHASHPLAIGHYTGDGIGSTGSVLNELLGEKRLAIHHAMHLYPEQPGRAEVISVPGKHPPGALVIGLGEVGEVTEDIVSKGISEAVLRFALAHCVPEEAPNAVDRRRHFAISSLLIGSQGTRGLSVEGSVAAIVTGVILANRSLTDQGMADKIVCDEVEFVEIREHLAQRAAHAILTVQNRLRMDLTQAEAIEARQYLLRGEGGYLGHTHTEYDRDWWRQLKISERVDKSQRGEAGKEEAQSGALEFVSSTERARAEITFRATQKRLIDQMVQQTEASRDMETPLTLYDLLIPRDLPLDATNLILVVDERTAQYPWEMIARRPIRSESSGNRPLRPLAVDIGMIRQLALDSFRVQIDPSRLKNALVIGNPKLTDPRFQPLPGARKEAENVATLLEGSGYSVTKLIDADPLPIIKALYAREYQIIHIAGHGVYRAERPSQTGVVLGNGIYLTASEISNLRIVPGLVFLNCCHLGVIDDDEAKEGREDAGAWNKLAASISQEVIKAGVKAVVAAGWEVNDGAADHFARTLYTQMLQEKRPYGEAVRLARAAIFENGQFTRHNTWGAYQCYGDPNYRLVGSGDGDGPTSKQYVSHREILQQLKEIQARASRAEDADWMPRCKKATDALKRYLQEKGQSDWFNGEMHNEFGDTYAEIKEYHLAIEHYRAALQASGSKERVPFRAAEQLANLSGHYAVEVARHWHSQQPDKQAESGEEWQPENLLADARKKLEMLLEMQDTPERRGLLGSHFKRCAHIHADEAREADLKLAIESYEQAATANPRASHRPNFVNNAAFCRIVQKSPPVEGKTKKQQAAAIAQENAELEAYIPRIGDSLKAAAAEGISEHSYWDRIYAADARLAVALIALRTGKEPERSAADVAKLYRETFEMGGTQREQNATLQTIHFLVDLLTNNHPQPAAFAREVLTEVETKERGKS